MRWIEPGACGGGKELSPNVSCEQWPTDARVTSQPAATGAGLNPEESLLVKLLLNDVLRVR